MAAVDRALVAPPKLRACILAHRKEAHFVFPRPAVPDDFADFTHGQLRPSVGEDGRYSMKVIIDAVCDLTGWTLLAIRSDRRTRPLSRARLIIYWLSRHLTGLSLPNIGSRLGGRDHTTILWGCRRVEKTIQDEGIQISDDLHVMARRLLASDWVRTA